PPGAICQPCASARAPTFSYASRWASVTSSARELRDRGTLPPLGAEELAAREAASRYDGRTAPRPRRLPAVARAGGAVAAQLAGRVRLLRPAPR
ncbi:hypothetical protein ACWDSE_16615, partial [Micromonospora chersina]